MAKPKVYFVHLRRPASASKDPNEKRDDPFYECGSFGCTKCHSKNLLHPKHAMELEGARLAFVQGGKHGSRLVYLTPRITVKKWANNCEVKWTWTPAEMPFKYKKAPILVSNNGRSDFPAIRKFAMPTDGRKIEGHFSSMIRSRATPLEPKLAQEVVSVYEGKRKDAPASAIAKTYDESLPRRPPKVDRNRKATYRFFIAKLKAESDGKEISSLGKGARRGTQSQSRCGR
jgi:hypothetical protein